MRCQVSQHPPGELHNHSYLRYSLITVIVELPSVCMGQSPHFFLQWYILYYNMYRCVQNSPWNAGMRTHHQLGDGPCSLHTAAWAAVCQRSACMALYLCSICELVTRCLNQPLLIGRVYTTLKRCLQYRSFTLLQCIIVTVRIIVDLQVYKINSS